MFKITPYLCTVLGALLLLDTQCHAISAAIARLAAPSLLSIARTPLHVSNPRRLLVPSKRTLFTDHMPEESDTSQASHSLRSTSRSLMTLAAVGLAIPKQIHRSRLLERPETVQNAVDAAFEHNKAAIEKTWLYHGCEVYELMGINEEKMINHLAQLNPEKKDVYILDIGCGNGRWGRQRRQDIRTNTVCKQSGKKFHILSITGGSECDNATIQDEEHVVVHQLKHCKIENIEEELIKRGFDLHNQVDWIVSNWALRHMVDPAGTLGRLYRLLSPTQGILMCNGFLIAYDGAHKPLGFPKGQEAIVCNSNATTLFRHYSVQKDFGHFMLLKNDSKELNLPLAYTGSLLRVADRWQCASERSAVFTKDTDISPFEYDNLSNEMMLRHYCNKGDHKCKNLYDYLKKCRLFCNFDW